ncbi:MAG: S1C family serine protease [Anaerolineae bacterium]
MRNLKQIALYSLTIGLCLALGFAAAFTIMPRTANAIDDIGLPRVDTNDVLLSQETTYSQIYQTVAPSVVSISIQARRGANTAWLPVSTGSGFMVDELGHVVTNYHVVASAQNIGDLVGEGAQSRIEVALFDGTITRAEIVGTDPDSDIAVIDLLDVPEERLYPVSFADSDALEEGQVVFALGNPFSNNWTLTTGIISALNRSIPSLDVFSTGGVIQTDAAINPGNSGGPLVNINGQVIGVNSQINSEDGTNTGIGFAVPSNLVIRVANELIETGDVEYSYLGITSVPISLSLIETYDLPNNIRGVGINQVVADAPAGDAGLRNISPNSVDIITAIDGRPIADFDELIGYLSIHTAPGDDVVFTVYRGGQILELETTLTQRPN